MAPTELTGKERLNAVDIWFFDGKGKFARKSRLNCKLSGEPKHHLWVINLCMVKKNSALTKSLYYCEECNKFYKRGHSFYIDKFALVRDGYWAQIKRRNQ